jgi:glucosamine--fructose-6-phosphate aminotransferase (isomerizing)
MMIGRGPTLAIAREAALKLKETCHLHAEAFSSAEFQHGPITLVEPAYPVLLFRAGRSGGRRPRDVAHRSPAQGRFRVLDRSGVRSGISSDLAPDHPMPMRSA